MTILFETNKYFTKWDLHHLHYHYKNKLNEKPVKELIENNVIVLITQPFHDLFHTADVHYNLTDLENKLVIALTINGFIINKSLGHNYY